jgi:chromosome segregation ATPase
MTDEAPQDPILRELERVDQEALEKLRARMAALENKALEQAHSSFARYERQFEDLLQRMSDAKQAFEESSDELRGKLVEGPVNDDELRARLVILDMEYGSRMRLAEEGFRLLRKSFEDHLDGERVRARGFADDARDALRERVHLGRGKILEVFSKRDELVSETRGELARLRLELDKARRKVGEGGPTELFERKHFEQMLEERDRQLDKTRGTMQQLEAKLENLARQATRSTQAEQKISELRAALKKATAVSPKAADDARDKLRERLGEALAARAQAEGAMNKLRALLHETEARLGEREAEISALKTQGPAIVESPPPAPLPVPDPVGESVERVRMHELGAKVDRLREENEQLKAQLAAAKKAQAPAPVDDARIRELEQQLALSEGGAELAEARKRIAELEQGAVSGAPEVAPLQREIADLRRKVREIEAVRDIAQAKAEESEEALAAQRTRMKDMQKTLLGADVSRDRRFEEERAKWDIEREEVEEKMLQAQRELKTLKTLHQQSERDWEQTLTQQDAKRMQEIFKLRAEIQKLKWKTSGPEGDGPKAA